MPPPKAAVLPLTLVLFSVACPCSPPLYTPPPVPAVLPLTVQFFSVAVPLRLSRPPP